jgi:hypothetical protein
MDTPLFEWGPLPQNNVFQFLGLNAPAGTTSPAVGVGYFLLLEPLSVGQHVINYGFVGNPPGITFNITVVPEPTSLMIHGTAVVAGLVTCRRSRRIAEFARIPASPGSV